MKSIQIAAIVIFLFVGCAPSEAAIQTAIVETQQVASTNRDASSVVFVQPPIEALDKAYEVLNESLPLLLSFAEDVSDFELDRSVSLNLNRADSLNQVDEKWCLGILFLQQEKETGEYIELGDVFLVTDSKAGWEAFKVSSLDNSGGIMSTYESEWDQCLFR